ncbi:hypothetical protein A9Q99_27000 [Gammaproteobacteria bacterium 45_16_T64]|nr:hypothetical protein A9Q99_27000 [Gammaproteobacteria bacterium 45_16_T64]
MKNQYCAIAVIGLMFSNWASAGVSDKTKDAARNLFEQGLVHCTNALESSRSDQGVSQQEFDTYTTVLSRAEALYPGIAEDSQKAARQIKQCSQIGEDIARYKALPLLEQGVLACKEAKLLAKGDYLSKARAKYREYVSMRDRALSLTGSVLKVASNSSKVRRCDKLEDGLMAAQTRIDKEEIDANSLIALLARSNDSCQVAQQMAVKSGVSRPKLEATKAMVSVGENYFSEASLHQAALQRAQNYPGYDSSKSIASLTSKYTLCNSEIKVVLKTATQAVVRLEERDKRHQQQKIAKAVEDAVREAKEEAIASLASKEVKEKPRAFKKPEFLIEMEEVVAAIPQNQVQDDATDIDPASEGAVTPAPVEREKKAFAKSRGGKGVARKGVQTEVVQVSNPW